MRSDIHNRKKVYMLDRTVDIPIDLYESMKGRYFTAETPLMPVGTRSKAWGALINPVRSRVNLHVNVATLNFAYGEPVKLSFYLNAALPGRPRVSRLNAPANTAILPLLPPKAKLLYASGVKGEPQEGFFSLSRTAYPGATTILEKNGKFIIPPGGNYCAFVDTVFEEQDPSELYLAFGWWEEPV